MGRCLCQVAIITRRLSQIRLSHVSGSKASQSVSTTSSSCGTCSQNPKLVGADVRLNVVLSSLRKLLMMMTMKHLERNHPCLPHLQAVGSLQQCPMNCLQWPQLTL